MRDQALGFGSGGEAGEGKEKEGSTDPICLRAWM